MFHTLAYGGIAAPAVYLRPASDAHLQAMPRGVKRQIPAELLDKMRPFGAGPYQAHIAPKHIEQLRQFVQPSEAQESAPGVGRRRDPFPVAFRQTGSGQSSELVKQELPAAAADALLREKNRSPGTDPDDNSERRQHRREENQAGGRNYQVDSALGKNIIEGPRSAGGVGYHHKRAGKMNAAGQKRAQRFFNRHRRGRRQKLKRLSQRIQVARGVRRNRDHDFATVRWNIKSAQCTGCFRDVWKTAAAGLSGPGEAFAAQFHQVRRITHYKYPYGPASRVPPHPPAGASRRRRAKNEVQAPEN